MQAQPVGACKKCHKRAACHAGRPAKRSPGPWGPLMQAMFKKMNAIKLANLFAPVVCAVFGASGPCQVDLSGPLALGLSPRGPVARHVARGALSPRASLAEGQFVEAWALRAWPKAKPVLSTWPKAKPACLPTRGACASPASLRLHSGACTKGLATFSHVGRPVNRSSGLCAPPRRCACQHINPFAALGTKSPICPACINLLAPQASTDEIKYAFNKGHKIRLVFGFEQRY